MQKDASGAVLSPQEQPVDSAAEVGLTSIFRHLVVMIDTILRRMTRPRPMIRTSKWMLMCVTLPLFLSSSMGTNL